MKEIQLTRNKTTVVDDEDYNSLNQYKWYCTPDGYAARQVGGFRRQVTEKMARIIVDCPDDMVVDHINGAKLDNRKNNLRICTRIQNSYNRKNKKGSYSQYRGVSKVGNKWKASITKDGERFYLGLFFTEIDAAYTYDLKAIKLYGKFARLNILANNQKEST